MNSTQRNFGPVNILKTTRRSRMKKLSVLFLVVALFGLLPEAGAAPIYIAHVPNVTTYTSNLGWVSACTDCDPKGIILSENFEDPTLLTGLTIDSDYGIKFLPSPANSPHPYFIEDRVGPSETTYFNYNAMYGFAGNFELDTQGLGTGILISINSGTGNVYTPIGEVDDVSGPQFFGFRTNYAFTSIMFSMGSQDGTQETYYNLDSAFCATNPVPIPAAAWLLGTGLIGLVGIRRRFKK
jgi:hypothetical protein